MRGGRRGEREGARNECFDAGARGGGRERVEEVALASRSKSILSLRPRGPRGGKKGKKRKNEESSWPTKTRAHFPSFIPLLFLCSAPRARANFPIMTSRRPVYGRRLQVRHAARVKLAGRVAKGAWAKAEGLDPFLFLSLELFPFPLHGRRIPIVSLFFLSPPFLCPDFQSRRQRVS